MNLKFWKKTPLAEDSEVDSQEKPGDKSASRKSPGGELRRKEPSGDKDGEPAIVSPAYLNRRLIISAAIGVLISVAIGLASWKIFLPLPSKKTATADTATAAQPNPFAERKVKLSGQIEFLQLRKAQLKSPQADIEALRKKNNELPPMEVSKVEPPHAEDLPGASRRAEIEILEKKNDEPKSESGMPREEQQQQPSAPPANQVAGGSQLPIRGGEMAVGNKDPKAAAMTLREAIEAMNANSGDPARRAVK